MIKPWPWQNRVPVEFPRPSRPRLRRLLSLRPPRPSSILHRCPWRPLPRWAHRLGRKRRGFSLGTGTATDRRPVTNRVTFSLQEVNVYKRCDEEENVGPGVFIG